MERPIYIYDLSINLPSLYLSYLLWAIDGLGKASKFTIYSYIYYYEYDDFQYLIII